MNIIKTLMNAITDIKIYFTRCCLVQKQFLNCKIRISQWVPTEFLFSFNLFIAIDTADCSITQGKLQFLGSRIHVIERDLVDFNKIFAFQLKVWINIRLSIFVDYIGIGQWILAIHKLHLLRKRFQSSNLMFYWRFWILCTS